MSVVKGEAFNLTHSTYLLITSEISYTFYQDGFRETLEIFDTLLSLRIYKLINGWHHLYNTLDRFFICGRYNNDSFFH